MILGEKPNNYRTRNTNEKSFGLGLKNDLASRVSQGIFTPDFSQNTSRSSTTTVRESLNSYGSYYAVNFIRLMDSLIPNDKISLDTIHTPISTNVQL